MKEKKILPLVLSMSLPMVISMAVNALYNIIDSYFVAKVSENAMAALALVFPVQNLINAIAIGFGIGINAGISIFSVHLKVKKQIRPQPSERFFPFCRAQSSPSSPYRPCRCF